MADPDADSLSTRLSLLYRVRDLDDGRSWEEFFHRYAQLVQGLARRRGLREHEVEEVAQEVFKRVARTIHRFERAPRTGAFRKWLGQLTRWRADDKLRERLRQPELVAAGEDEGTPLVERLPAPPDPELEFEEETRRHLLDTLFKRLESQVPPKQVQVFQLLVIDGLPPDEVARMFGMTKSHIYVIKHRLTEKLRETVRQLPVQWE